MEAIARYKRKARKEHICDTCGSKIYKGEEYEIQTNKFDGKLYTWKSCYYCEPLVKQMFEEGHQMDIQTMILKNQFISTK